MNLATITALNQGACIVTATKRLAYELGLRFDEQQRSQGKQVWQSANVITWDTWMLSLWTQSNSQDFALCLNGAQCQHLFAEIIQADTNHDDAPLAGLLNANEAAKIALDAWQLCHQWQITYRTLHHAEHPDHARFGRWVMQFHAQLQKNQWLSNAQLPDVLRTRGVTLDKPTYLLGFEQLTSQQSTFIAHFKDQPVAVKFISNSPIKNSEPTRCTFADERSQWQAVAMWARKNIVRTPKIRLGIICPDVRPIRHIASECLREQLTPQSFQSPALLPVNFSATLVLANVPLIQNALDILRLLNPMNFSQCKTCLMSPFWGTQTQQKSRQRLMVGLGKRLAARFDLFTLIQTLGNFAKDESSQQVVQQLKVLQAIKTKHRGKLALAGWRKVFQTCLTAVNWPAEPLNSDEFQAFEAWNHSLDEWVKLDVVCKPMRFPQALSSIVRHVSRIQFQAQAMLDAPVQVVGAREAAELHFDAIWLAGFDEQAWPSAMHANPFVPIQSQSNAGVPEANAHSFAAFYQRKTQALLSMSKNVRVSHAQTKADISLTVSPLFSEIKSEKFNALPDTFNLQDSICAATGELQTVQDDVGLALSAGHIRGGTGLVRDQALCPFKAYANYRLQIQEIKEPELGLDALDRGSLLHEILASIWQEIRSSKQLHQHINNQTLEALLTRHIDKNLNKFTKQTSFKEGFKSAQSNRILQLLSQWMVLEAQRPHFSVSKIEYLIEMTVNGLRINMTLDRLDEMLGPDGQMYLAIIDYKSGQCNINHWAGKRLSQPQIPLYYLALNALDSQAVSALAFAQVKQHACQFVGLSAFEEMLPEVKTIEQLWGSSTIKKQASSWDDLATTWQQYIESLVVDFQQGKAIVDPLPSACEYCDYSPLCRISSRNDR